MNALNGKVIFIIGVSGSGKSTVGQLLANKLSVKFIDADDHHLPSNIEKMSRGAPLTDKDRDPWLNKMNEIAIDHLESGAVIACSGLKEKYRARLTQNIESNSAWVYLKGDYELIYNRMKSRKGHFMDAGMLKSQFDTLQEPLGAMTVNIAEPLDAIVEKIRISLVSV